MKEDNIDFYSFAPTYSETAAIDEKTYTCISLQKLVGQVINRLSSKAALQTNLIENNVPQKMLVSTDKVILTAILGSLLHTIIKYSQNNCIHISAKLIGNITLMHIRTNDISYSKAIVESFYEIEPLAEKLGGCVTISENEMQGSALAFTFINQ